ncbi:hypothetical protein [Burkholderia ubonensis]|uniref:Uncharacterized protein n=1 Tax=Burkholderia ubonensis TaxID=101571 RepID=A0ABD4EAK0_9BURK|nr:hypothetical protein [Burkholderia ubonensis]KVN92565.1 hypothetical protein WJ68_33630 [Burkholderia ubonensis]
MSGINNGGPAFPVECDYVNGKLQGRQTDYTAGWHEGMTLRDYFAAKALPGIYERTCKMLEENRERVTNVYDIAAIAAYEQADAMIRARGDA